MKLILDNTAKNRFTYPFRLACNHCKSILEVEDGDVKLAQGSEMQNTSAYFYVKCPACNAGNTVRPQSIREPRSCTSFSNLANQIASIESQGQSDR